MDTPRPDTVLLVLPTIPATVVEHFCFQLQEEWLSTVRTRLARFSISSATSMPSGSAPCHSSYPTSCFVFKQQTARTNVYSFDTEKFKHETYQRVCSSLHPSGSFVHFLFSRCCCRRIVGSVFRSWPWKPEIWPVKTDGALWKALSNRAYHKQKTDA